MKYSPPTPPRTWQLRILLLFFLFFKVKSEPRNLVRCAALDREVIQNHSICAVARQGPGRNSRVSVLPGRPPRVSLGHEQGTLASVFDPTCSHAAQAPTLSLRDPSCGQPSPQSRGRSDLSRGAIFNPDNMIDGKRAALLVGALFAFFQLI